MENSKKASWTPTTSENDLRSLRRKNSAFGTSQAEVHVLNPEALEKRVERQLELERDDSWEVGELLEADVEKKTEGDGT